MWGGICEGLTKGKVPEGAILPVSHRGCRGAAPGRPPHAPAVPRAALLSPLSSHFLTGKEALARFAKKREKTPKKQTSPQRLAPLLTLQALQKFVASQLF